MKKSIGRAAVVGAVVPFVAAGSVLMAVPANANARPAVAGTQQPLSQVAPVRTSEAGVNSVRPGGFECVAYLRMFGYRITTARTLACGASYINKPVCIAGLLATRVRLTVATPACIL
ncbi:hypothetical protein [Terracoccus luteus]|uniref:Uncharacterized protein n=1 Tax=Terracoccus luteus TaxID=53356 RepID=A0A839PTL2_9MICO|nr:hypothetical protein [Terracoccus luteus]MBB2986383.1 hypothetical protein [Terracoccus luteus]MCP2172027.1 hypothetical protein [Terracoccus luteus]